MTITNEQADEYLANDLAPVETAINKALKVPVTANEFDAMASLWFNVGTYVKTSNIIREMNLGNVAAAAKGFDAYNKPAAIIGRRNFEKAQFLRKDDDVAPVVAARATSRDACGCRFLGRQESDDRRGRVAVRWRYRDRRCRGAPSCRRRIAGVLSMLAGAISGAFGWRRSNKAQTLSANVAAS